MDLECDICGEFGATEDPDGIIRCDICAELVDGLYDDIDLDGYEAWSDE